jgi:hypothetical protein
MTSGTWSTLHQAGIVILDWVPALPEGRVGPGARRSAPMSTDTSR